MTREKCAHPRKFKIDKKFQPVSMDVGDEFYPNGIFVFNITKLLRFIKANPAIFQPEEVLIKTVRAFPPTNLNESIIQDANITAPIILAEISLERFNVIDGNHRLEKAYRDEINKIPAYRVRAEQHIAFITSVASYEAYIEYWNSKLMQ